MAADASANLVTRSAKLADEATAWVGGNIVDILIAAAIGIAIALVLIGIRSLGCRLVQRLSGEDWPAIFARAVAKTNLFFIVMCSAELVAEHAATPPALLRAIHILFVVAAALQAAIWARELILGYVHRRAGVEVENSNLASALSIIRLLVTVALFAIAIILILSNIGVNVTGLIAGLGIGGIAIGLAAQGIFSDLFAALSIIFDKPFRRGDTISFDQTSGTVERIGLKSTRIRSVGGEEVIISNAKLLDTRLQNWTRLEHRRALVTLQLTHQTPPDLLARLPEELAAIVGREPLAVFDRAHLAGFAASSVDFELVFFVKSADLDAFMLARQQILLAILRRFAELGVSFAYPTQTTYTAAPDGRLVMPYAPPKEAR
ncbi:MAG TPA: mechanosensitive ion channel family protein [Allosphingosinicella sp.]|nr:mechanosensitive ion channel family protein [Allosphingosinicella sp.]